MSPTIVLAVAQGVGALLDIWRQHANKPADWTPTAQDWNDLLTLNDKTAEDYKKEAAARLGLAWPPAQV